VDPAYPRDLPARALLAPPAPISTAPSHLASSLALDSSNTGVSDLTLLLCDTSSQILGCLENLFYTFQTPLIKGSSFSERVTAVKISRQPILNCKSRAFIISCRET
jgi:hypothetical protein